MAACHSFPMLSIFMLYLQFDIGVQISLVQARNRYSDVCNQVSPTPHFLFENGLTFYMVCCWNQLLLIVEPVWLESILDYSNVTRLGLWHEKIPV